MLLLLWYLDVVFDVASMKSCMVKLITSALAHPLLMLNSTMARTSGVDWSTTCLSIFLVSRSSYRKGGFSLVFFVLTGGSVGISISKWR